MSQLTGEFETYTPLYADLDELLGTQQLWERHRKLVELYDLYEKARVDEVMRRSPGLDLDQIEALLQAG